MKLRILFILTFCASFFPTRLAEAQEPVSAVGKFVTVNGAKIYYEEYGQGEPLILLHGFAQTLSHWRPYIAELSKQYRVIAWDMRGHGRSTNPDTSKVFLHATAARDLLAFLHSLHLDKVKIMGHSSDGVIILYAASMQPDRFDAIIPMSAQVYYSDQVREFISKNAQPEQFYNFMELERKHGKVKGKLVARQFYNFRELYGDPAITPDQLAKIKARTLIIHGDNDFVPVSQAWEMYQHIPKARLWIVANGWHEPHVGPENEADFIRVTLEFLRGDWDKANLPK